MIVYLSITGIFISAILLYYNAANYKSSVYLGLYFMTVCFYGINQQVVLWSNSVFWISIIATNFTFLLYLIGPLSYLYIRSIVSDDARLKKTDVLHLIPMLIFLLASLPYILTSYDYKTEIARRIIQNREFLANYNFTVLSEWFSIQAVYVSRPFIALIYIFFSGKLIWKFFYANTTKAIDRFTKNWLITFFNFQSVLVFNHLLYILIKFNNQNHTLTVLETAFNFLSVVGMMGLIISPILFPRILYGFPIILEGVQRIKEQNENQMSIKKESNKKSKTYDSDYMIYIEEEIDRIMAQNKLYLQKDLNLPQLSVLLTIPTHHLAYFFSAYKKMTFSDYRTILRIEYAKELMIGHTTNNLTLEGIALLSGFSNRNNFTQSFKKVEGTTPSSFITNCNK